MEICEEMKKLRSILDDKKILWEDASEEWETCCSPEPEARIELRKYYIHRTWLQIDGKPISVINGFGTTGGWSDFTPLNEGCLELRTDGINDGDPVGWLSADDVIELLEKKFGKLGGINDIT